MAKHFFFFYHIVRDKYSPYIPANFQKKKRKKRDAIENIVVLLIDSVDDRLMTKEEEEEEGNEVLSHAVIINLFTPWNFLS